MSSFIRIRLLASGMVLIVRECSFKQYFYHHCIDLSGRALLPWVCFGFVTYQELSNAWLILSVLSCLTVAGRWAPIPSFKTRRNLAFGNVVCLDSLNPGGCMQWIVPSTSKRMVASMLGAASISVILRMVLSEHGRFRVPTFSQVPVGCFLAPIWVLMRESISVCGFLLEDGAIVVEYRSGMKIQQPLEGVVISQVYFGFRTLVLHTHNEELRGMPVCSGLEKQS